MVTGKKSGRGGSPRGWRGHVRRSLQSHSNTLTFHWEYTVKRQDDFNGVVREDGDLKNISSAL